MSDPRAPVHADIDAGYGSAVLYRMCAEQPHHHCRDIVAGKLWLIGRAYSASLERKAGSNFDYDKAADAFISSEIDTHLLRLRSIMLPTRDNIDTVLAAHKSVTDLTHDLARIAKRSFASKYLHFHAPLAVFLYDQYSSEELARVLRKHHAGKQNRIAFPVGHDDAYARYAMQSMFYRDHLHEQPDGRPASPRVIDNTLQRQARARRLP